MKRLMVGLGILVCLLLACAKNDDTAKNGMTSGQSTTSTTAQNTSGQASGSATAGGHDGNKKDHGPQACTDYCTGALDTFDVDDFDDHGKDTPVCVSAAHPVQKTWAAKHRTFILVDIQ